MGFLFILGLALIALQSDANASCKGKSVWTWSCKNNRCVKAQVETGKSPTDVHACKLTCGEDSMLFPKPSGHATFGKTTVPFIPTQVQLSSVTCKGKNCQPRTKWLVDNAFSFFQRTLEETYSAQSTSASPNIGNDCAEEAKERSLRINIELKSDDTELSLDMDESYSLEVKTTDSTIEASITAGTFFGARHALETVSQMTAYLESHDAMQILNKAVITDDKPSYKYRGLMLDTSRNFFSVDSILRLIRAMSYNKLNTLHWHITDTHSFPIEIKSVPELTQYGKYSTSRVYKQTDVRKIVNYAKVHGIRVLPEFDEPAHCGEGWQWGPKKGLGNLAVCVNKEPWQKYCVEPPCGQLNPTNDNVYDILGKIYKEYFQLFEPDIFHAGGDEVNINCWNTTTEITDWLKKNYGGVKEENFMDMWKMFLEKTTKKIYEANNGKELPLVLWTSKMTSDKYLTKYMDPKKHIVQIWTGSKNPELSNIVKNNFRTIFSTYDTLYLDCGYGNWLIEGNNWCSPYKDWKLLYDNDPVKILKSFNVTVTDKVRESILGQEAAMWTEQVDENASEGKIWPRTAALAERLWSNPKHNWRNAEYRMIYHRERLVERGIRADALQPLWCQQNAGHCYYDPAIKGEH